MKKCTIYIFLIFSLLIGSKNVLAQVTGTQQGSVTGTQQGAVTGDTTGAKTVNLNNPLGSADVPTLIGRVIKGVLGIVGSLALVMVIYGGFTWMLAAGNSEKVKKGRDIIVWAAIGLVVIFTSYALVSFVIKTIS